MLGNGDAGRRGRGADHPQAPPSLDGPNAMAGAPPRPHARALLASPSAPPLPVSYLRQVGRVRVPISHDVARRPGDDGRGGSRGSGQGGGGGGCRRERKQRRTHAGGAAHTKKNGAWRDAEGGKTPARGLGWRQGAGAWVGVCDGVSRRVASARGRRRHAASPKKKSGGRPGRRAGERAVPAAPCFFLSTSPLFLCRRPNADALFGHTQAGPASPSGRAGPGPSPCCPSGWQHGREGAQEE